MSEPMGTSAEEERLEPLSFTLQIISPSIGVTGPLNFPLLPAATTVKQLKAKIRDALPSKPVDESQRLIHRGRMLARETETMLEIFGQETLANPEPQTLHLVLRPTASEGPSSRVTAPVPAAPAQPPIVNPLAQQFPRPQSTPVNPMYGMHAQQPLPGFQHVQQHQVLHQVEHIQNMMAQRLQHLQRETQRLHQEMGLLEQRARTQAVPGSLPVGQQPPAPQNPAVVAQSLFQGPLRQAPVPPALFQNFINQQQRERAADGRQGVQDTGAVAVPFGSVPPTASGRASPNIHRPDHTTTYTREGVGPNGERWHVTVNETTTTVPTTQSQPQPHQHHHHQHGGVNPALDIQAVLRNADRFMAAQGGRNSMQRSSSVPPGGSTPFAPGVTRPGTPASINTPATTTSSPSASLIPNPPPFLPTLPVWNANPQLAASNPSSSTGPVAYILSSPSGPRALLVSDTETFFTPRHHSRRHQSPAAVLSQVGAPAGLPEYRNRPAQRARRNHRQQQDGAPLEPINAPHANPGGGALAARVGPLLWLVARLIGFVWFFTAGNPSWTRWLMVSGLAFVVFIINTGVFNGLAEQIWGPVRRHLEGLIPLAPRDPDPLAPGVQLPQRLNAQQLNQREELRGAADADPQHPGGAAPNETPQQRRRPGELDEAEVAARLIDQHRQANAGWLITQIRRAEHSLLLFLASLVPGVGERHVRARELENAAIEEERQRQIQAAEAANATETSEENAAGETARGNTELTGEDGEHVQPENQDAPLVPLVEVGEVIQ
ncbi:hypothetical protein N431DRAFT_478156 [Stipitochalara longipes BDJ]|nr:hypothetical protein N431DRAFT_478156 [Stipitochalara longipes BDJ]